MDVIVLKDLPKVSLNKFYAGTHWTVRNNLKNTYKLIINSQIRHVYPKTEQYHVKYFFVFKSRPLDASNCVAMVKMIEDVIFEDDSYKIVKGLEVYSVKGKEDLVRIEINKL
jgi:hypothetical protein